MAIIRDNETGEPMFVVIVHQKALNRILKISKISEGDIPEFQEGG